MKKYCFLFLLFYSMDLCGDYLSLKESIERALFHSPLIEASKKELSVFEAKYLEAVSTAYPYAELRSIFSVIPAQRGTPEKGSTDYDEFGYFTQTEISGILPVWTFGKISNLKKIAQTGIDVGKSKIKVAEEEVRFRTISSYYSLLLFNSLMDIINEGKEYFEKAKKHLLKMEEEDSPDFDPVDKQRLIVYESEIEEKKIVMERARRLIITSLAISLGIKDEKDVQLKENEIKPIIVENKDLDFFINTALKHRSEIIALKNGITVRSQICDLKRSEFFPDIFIGGLFKIGRSNVADEQSSPFAYDPFNTYTGGAVLGLKMGFDFGKKIARLREADAELQKTEALLKEVEQGVKIEVEKAFLEMNDAKKLMEINKKSMEAARGWVIAKVDLYEGGFVEFKDITDALSEFYKRKIAFKEAIYNFNISVGKMERAAGIQLISGE